MKDSSEYARLLQLASISLPPESKINEYYTKCKDLSDTEIIDMTLRLMPSKNSKIISTVISSIRGCNPIEISDMTVNKLTMMYPSIANEISKNPDHCKKLVSVIDNLVKEMQSW